MTTSKQVYHKQFHCPQCGDLLSYQKSTSNDGLLNDLLFCESCETFENLASERGKVFVEVLSDRRRVTGLSSSKFVLKDYQLKTPVSYALNKWLVYDLGKEKVFFFTNDKSYEVECLDMVLKFANCTEMLGYFQPRFINYERSS
jgi:hypothetical protein